MSHPTCCCSVSLDRCDRCDLLVGLEGFHLMSVARTPGASGRPGDPLGDPTVALRRSHHCRIGPPVRNHVEHRVVPHQAVSASRI